MAESSSTQKNFVNYLSDGFKNIKLDGGAGSIEGTPGTLRVIRPSSFTELDFTSGELIIDTDSAKISHSSGQFGYGIIEDHYYRDDGSTWPYSVCRFTFDRIRIGGKVVVEIKGQNAVLLEAAAGNLRLGANLYANGNHASEDVGGLGVLGGFDGVDVDPLLAMAPGAPENSDQDMVLPMVGMDSGELPCMGIIV